MKRLVRVYLDFLLIGISVLFCQAAYTQKPPYRDASLPVDNRVKDLIQRMTPEEKFRQIFMIPGDLSIGKENLMPGIFGFRVRQEDGHAHPADQLVRTGSTGSAGEMAARVNETQRFFLEESRLGIPVIQFDEALHGLTREGATAFPQAIGLAATFDTGLMHRVARAIAAETRSRGIRMVLSPVLNIARDVRWGRTEETYGEDPYLVACMGAAFISEFEKAGVITTPKHYAVNVGDGGRDSYPIHYNERILEEIYFPAFKTAVTKAGAGSVMTAYNSLDGTPCSMNDWLLNQKLKGEWGFKGFVISDACAVGGANVLHYTASGYAEAGKQAIENGLDVIFQTDISHAGLFQGPFLDGSVRQGAIDSAVTRVLSAKFRLGLFEDPNADPRAADRINGAPEHRALALEAARKSIVLLKNDGSILPLSPTLKKIAIIGTDATEARLGGYSGEGNRKISILDGMFRHAADSIEILYSPGCGRTDRLYEVIPGKYLSPKKDGKATRGLMAEYFANNTLEGSPVVTRTDQVIDFNWTLYSPDPALPYDWYSARWTGTITPDTTGLIRIGVEGNDGYRLYLDDRLIMDNWIKKSNGTRMAEVSFETGRSYDLRLEYFESTGNARLKLIWDKGLADSTEEVMQTAGYLAEQADLTIVVAGIEEGEFRDRSSLQLPGRQEELINTVAAVGKPVVVILVGGSAVTMKNWLENVQAVVDVWYPGEAGGEAVADVLSGKVNPAGRLPVTFPVSEGQLPLVYNHKPTGRGDDYLDGSGMPLFPFGYGLSYTTFGYSDLQIEKEHLNAGDSAIIRFRLTNTGKVAGDEVCQLYLRDELSSVSRPVMELKGFCRVNLAPGESRIVHFSIPPEAMAMLDKNMQRVIEPGTFRIMIGGSSQDIKLRGRFFIMN